MKPILQLASEPGKTAIPSVTRRRRSGGLLPTGVLDGMSHL